MKLTSMLAMLFAAVLCATAGGAETTSTMTTTEPKNIDLTVATYNIMHGKMVKCDYTVIAADIAAVNPDIIGLQEVDMKTNRIGNVNALEIIAKRAGYKYYRFTKAINLEGGEYGTAIMSKFPIESCETIPLESGVHEKRSVGHAVLRIHGRRVDFFNTHLSYEAKKIRTGQFAHIARLTAECGAPWLLTGDFNTSDFSEFSVFADATTANNAANKKGTFPESNDAIDNIVMSREFVADQTAIHPNNHSDHYMFHARLHLTDK